MRVRNRMLCSMSAAALMGSAHMASAQAPATSRTNVSGEELEEVVVIGLRASLEAAAEIKKNADQVVDSIVADDIGKFPDNTTAAALQRVPGVQVVVGDNNEIVAPLIRGIGDILTTLDGREIFSGVGRGFAFQDLPAEALGGADVYKSNTANLIEGGVAGVINLKLHKPFDFAEGMA
ncbi:MAG: TonB-dependent receptor plug domain-containing protein, partial [Steroidobacteraceae bacterium]